jgi:hypothetical protein
MSALHTGSCLAVSRVSPPRAVRLPVVLGVQYCLHDAAGRPLGTIPAPAVRPITGPSAPTFYLRRGS